MMKNNLFLILLSGLFSSCQNQPLELVKFVDLNKYAGKWYEIASYPQRFQKGCTCTTAEYTITDKNYISVFNRCIVNNQEKSITGKAFVVKNSNNAKLKVQFFWPFKGNYQIVELADDYSWAVVGEPSRKYLWILAREPHIDDILYQDILERIAKKNFNLDKLVKTSNIPCK
jgi:apolipoprotein D and lipocalin family protein